MKWFALAILIMGLGLIGCAPSVQDDRAILNGTLTPPENPLRHSVVFIMKGANYFCSANVIAQDVLLTAAHCVSDFDPRSGRAVVVSPSKILVFDTENVKPGSAPALLTRGLAIKAQGKYLADPKGVYNPNYDVALVKLETALPSFYKPVKIAPSFEDVYANQIGVAGYGITSALQRNPDMKLRHGGITLSRQSYFSTQFGTNGGGLLNIPSLLANRPFSSVFAFRKGPQDATHCSGDSGGALYYVSNGEIYLAGVNVAYIKSGLLGTSCGPNETRLSLSLVGAQKYFVNQAYKNLTGRELLYGARDEAKDPSTFEYHLANAPTISKTAFVDLTSIALIRDPKRGLIKTVSLSSARDACADPQGAPSASVGIWSQRVYSTALNGQTVLNIYVQDRLHPKHFTVIEGRMKLLGNRVRFVVLTPNGYVSADLPLLNCDFSADTF